MKKLIVVLFVVLLSGCQKESKKTANEQVGRVDYQHFTTSRGLNCVAMMGYDMTARAGGLSCNWEKFNKENSPNFNKE